MNEWRQSLHSQHDFRSGIKEFQAAYIQRDELTARVTISQDYQVTAGRWARGLLSVNRWFVEAVAFLMLAVMPRRDEEDTTERLCIAENCWSPSDSARAYAQSQNREPWVIDAVGARRFGALRTTIPKCHVPFEKDGDKGNRATLLEKLKAEVTERQLGSQVPKDILDAFWVALNQAEADAKVTDEYEWLPNFNFEIRGWISKANQGHSGTAPASQATDYNGPPPQQYTNDENLEQALQGLGISEAQGPASPPPGGSSAPQSQAPAGQPSGSPPQPQGPAGQSSGSGAKSLRRSIPDQPWQATYYTIGEVGDHRFRSDLWALVDDGGSGFDIYDVTGMFCSLFNNLPR